MSGLTTTILQHDPKKASYKITLGRSLIGLALGYAYLGEKGTSLAIP